MIDNHHFKGSGLHGYDCAVCGKDASQHQFHGEGRPMTDQPPSPSAAALALADQLRDMLNFTWSVAGNVLTFDSTRAALAIDAFAVQAVAAATAYPEPYPQLDYEGAAAARGDELTAEERAKPAASDLEQIVAVVGTWFKEEPGRSVQPQKAAGELYLKLAAALAERGRVERERAVKLAEEAQLPSHFRWGHDAMEQFDFGKKRAAAAIRNQTLTGD